MGGGVSVQGAVNVALSWCGWTGSPAGRGQQVAGLALIAVVRRLMRQNDPRRMKE